MKYRRYTRLAKDIAVETVRSYLREGCSITIALFNAAQDCNIVVNTLSHYWYRREREEAGIIEEDIWNTVSKTR